MSGIGGGWHRRGGAPAGAIAVAVAVVLAVVVAGPSVARAASRVVLLRASSDDTLAQQGTTLLVAELKAAGFEVVEAHRDPARELRADIEAASARLDAVATFAVRPVPEGAAVELWLEDRVTGKLVIRRVDVGAGPNAPANLALKAVELLRGSLLEVTVDRPPPAPPGPGEPSPPPPAPLPVDLARFVSGSRYFTRGWGVAAGAALLASADLGAAYAPLVRIFWGGRDGLTLRLGASGLGTAPEVAAAEGTGRVHQTLVLGEALLVLRPDARLQPVVGAGAGALRVRAEGMGASAQIPGAAGAHTALALAAEAGVAARIGTRLSLVLDASLLFAYPRTRIVIASSEVARAGGVALLAALTLCTVF